MIKLQNAKKTLGIFLAALILISATLFCGKNVVLTNNGDFYRIIQLSSLTEDADGSLKIVLENRDFFGNLNQILFTPEDVSVYPSAQLIFVRFSVGLSYTLNVLTGTPLDTYHLGCLSFLYIGLYALAITFLLTQIKLKNKYASLIFTAISLIVLCDIGYVSYFNSLYAEGLQHILLIATLGFLIRGYQKRLRIRETILFAIVLVLLGQSKFFNVPLAILLVFAAVVISFRHPVEKKSLIVTVVSSVLAVVMLLCNYLALPRWISKETNYNSVFYGILKDCDDSTAKAYLRELELDSGMSELKNTHHYVSNFHAILEKYPAEQAEDISKLKLLGFYFSHPEVAVQKFDDIAQHSAHIRNIFFMDEAYMDGMFRCTIWSKVREHIGFDTLLLNTLVVFLFLGLLWYRFKRSALKNYQTVLLLCMAFGGFFYAFFIPYVSNGEADLAKHMYLFVELIDLAMLGILAMCFSLSKRVNGILAAVFAVVIASNMLSLKQCETVSFGGYTWYVIEETDSYKTLMSKDVIAKRCYNFENNNHYETSDIHRWLNGEFLSRFSAEERALLLEKEENIILSAAHLSERDTGYLDFYCSAYPKMVATNSDEVCCQIVSGYVFLPTVDHIANMANAGYSVTTSQRYWLSTPYFLHGGKSRYVHPDGLVYFDDTSEEFGIRPVIYLKKQ